MTVTINLTGKELSTKDVLTQLGEGCPVRTFFRTKGSLRTFCCKKHRIFRNLCVSARTRGV